MTKLSGADDRFVCKGKHGPFGHLNYLAVVVWLALVKRLPDLTGLIRKRVQLPATDLIRLCNFIDPLTASGALPG